MPNPFVIPGRGLGDRRPLSPSTHQEHRELYVPVDHTSDAYSSLQHLIGTVLGDGAQTRMIVVCGLEGTGKTSLIHRAVDWLDQQLKAADIRHYVVDLQEDAASGMASDARVLHLVSRLCDKIGLLGVLTEQEMDKLEQRKNDPANALPFLAELLAIRAQQGGKQTRMTVLLPRIEVQNELTTFAEASRTPLLVFSETTEEAIARGVESKYGTNAASLVRTLTLGGLELADGWRFVEQRLGRTPGAATSEQSVLDRFMSARIKGRGMTTILELNLTCQQVWATVEENGRSAVTYPDFQEFYVVKGSLT